MSAGIDLHLAEPAGRLVREIEATAFAFHCPRTLHVLLGG